MPGYEARFVEAAELRTLYDSDAEVKHSIDVAKGFVDKRRQDGIHAAAVVITKEPMLDYVPVQRKSGPNGSGEDAPIVTQYEATAIEKLGLLKMDFLGLRNLAIIERTLEHIRRRHGDRGRHRPRRPRRPEGLRDAAPRQLDRDLPARGRQDAPADAPTRARRASTTSRPSTRCTDPDR